MTQWEVFRERLETSRYGSVGGALRAAKMMKLKPHEDAVKLVEAWFAANAQPDGDPPPKKAKGKQVQLNGAVPTGVGMALMSIIADKSARMLLHNYFQAFAHEGVPLPIAISMLKAALSPDVAQG